MKNEFKGYTKKDLIDYIEYTGGREKRSGRYYRAKIKLMTFIYTTLIIIAFAIGILF